MKVNINDQYMLCSVDEKNFELHEYREVKSRDKEKPAETKWVGTGHYFQNIQSALIWMLDHAMIKDKQEFQNIKAAIERMEEIANGLKNVKVMQ